MDREKIMENTMMMKFTALVEREYSGHSAKGGCLGDVASSCCNGHLPLSHHGSGEALEFMRKRI